jgi:hypothetical protein
MERKKRIRMPMWKKSGRRKRRERRIAKVRKRQHEKNIYLVKLYHKFIAEVCEKLFLWASAKT